MPVMWWPRFETNVLLGFTRRCRNSETSRMAYAVTLSAYTRLAGRTLSRMLGRRVLDWALAMRATTTCPPRFNRPTTGPFPAAARPRLPLHTPPHAHSSASTSPRPCIIRQLAGDQLAHPLVTIDRSPCGLVPRPIARLPVPSFRLQKAPAASRAAVHSSDYVFDPSHYATLCRPV